MNEAISRQPIHPYRVIRYVTPAKPEQISEASLKKGHNRKVIEYITEKCPCNSGLKLKDCCGS